MVPLSATPNAVAVTYLSSGDVNGDGNTDLLTNLNGLVLLLGNGKGGFTEKAITNGPYDGDLAPTLVDLNGDGKADVVDVSPGGYGDPKDGCPVQNGAVNVWLGDGKGNFTASSSLPIQPSQYATVAVADFHHDGMPDVAVLHFSTQECTSPPYGNLDVFLSDGKGNLTHAYGATVFNEGFGLVAGDFNKDGRIDLAYLTTIFSNNKAEILTLDGNGDGSFRTGPSYTLADTPQGNPEYGYGVVDQLAAGDLNGDGRADLLINLGPSNAPGAQAKVASLLAKATGGFYWKSSVPVQTTSFPLFQPVDLNGDGRLDLLTQFYSTATPIVTTVKAYAGLGTGSFGTPQHILSQGTYSNPVAVPLTKGGSRRLSSSLLSLRSHLRSKC